MADDSMDVDDNKHLERSSSGDSSPEENEEKKNLFNETFQRFIAAGDDANTAAVKAIHVIRGMSIPDPGTTSVAAAAVPPPAPASAPAAETSAATIASPKDTATETDVPMPDVDRESSDDQASQQQPEEQQQHEQEDALVPVFTVEKLQAMLTESRQSGSYLPIIREVGSVFSSPSQVIQSFCLPNNDPNLAEASEIFRMLDETEENEGVTNSLRNALVYLGSQLNYPFSSHVNRRLIPVLVALEYEPFQYDPDLIKTISSLLQSIVTMPSESKTALVRFWGKQPKEYLQRMLATIQMFITLKVTLNTEVADFKHVKEGVIVLEQLHLVNQEHPFVSYDEFYNSAVNELATEDDSFLKEDLSSWFRANHDEDGNSRTSQGVVRASFCDYSFILDPGSKARVLQMEARVQQHSQFHDTIRDRLRGRNSHPYLILHIRREELVNDVLDIIARSDSSDFKKPLRVQFEGEEGVDEGGVRKEFFLLMVRRLLDPQFGMFVMDEESRQMWFNANTFEMALKFELVGIILGLAIYNGVILDLNFPVALYKKLLKRKPTLPDLKELHPALGKGLEDLLSFDGDVEDTFCRNFQLSYEVFGEVKTVDLKENGANIPVTKANRQEYVDLYVDYKFNKSVQHLFDPFQKGFHMVCGGTFLEMFHPEEMQLLLCGIETLDFQELEDSCRYDNGFTDSSPTIKYFWDVVHEFTDEDKKKLLMFTTGSDRVPIRGLSALRLTITKNGPDSDRLPVAHTCFGVLLLPEYKTREKLKDRLLVAISHSEGFGTM